MTYLHIIRSSAGSGKTRALARAYLLLSLRKSNHYFMHILALTFTNKASREMKQRILFYLDRFAIGQYDDLSNDLCQALMIDRKELSRISQQLLSSILHRYTQFSVLTIDTFFQRIVHSFVQEIGLNGGVRLEVDHQRVIKESVAALIDELGDNQQLTQWMINFAHDRMLQGKNWDVTPLLTSFAYDMLKERSKMGEASILEFKNPTDFHSHITWLKNVQKDFMNYMKKKADKALAILEARDISKEHFKYSDKGTAFKYFQSFSEEIYYPSQGSRIVKALEGAEHWYSKNNKKENIESWMPLTDKKLMPLLAEMVSHDEEYGKAYHTSQCILKKIYLAGLASNLLRKIEQYKKANNIMLIADTPQLIQKIINDSDVPFIYEKIGSYFSHYLIDEFQDTSTIEWKNLLPLLKDGIDRGMSSFVVGDVKQSIYRWRGGDPMLLKKQVSSSISKDMIKEELLDANYRSGLNIVQFNNILFKKASHIIQQEAILSMTEESFADVVQQHHLNKKGYVQISFLEKDVSLGYKEQAMAALLKMIETLQDKNVKLTDIAILTRDNLEAQQVSLSLLPYKHKKNKKNYRYDVVSNEALLLENSPIVRALLAALRYINDPSDSISYAQLEYEACQADNRNVVFQQMIDKKHPSLLSVDWLQSMKGKSVYELIEELIHFFDWGAKEDDMPYIHAFQDSILQFLALGRSDSSSFLEWWKNVREKKSIQMSDQVDAIKILTIHKSKGLQFKYVIIPFLHWKLNHKKNPTLWVTSKQSPFDCLGRVPVQYTSNLLDTYFDDDYQQERAKVYSDNLNLLYVSLTRAEEGLIVYAPLPTKDEVKTVGDLVYSAIKEDDELRKSYNKEHEKWVRGDIASTHDQQKKEEYATVILRQHNFSRWEKRITLKAATSYSRQNNVTYERLLRRILLKISYKRTAKQVQHIASMRYNLKERDKKRLSSDLQKMMLHPIIGKWFDEKWRVRSEVAMMGTKMNHEKVDRLITQGNHVIMINYLCDDNEEKNSRAINDYIIHLEKEKCTCEGYLVHLDDMCVKRVNPKIPTSL